MNRVRSAIDLICQGLYLVFVNWRFFPKLWKELSDIPCKKRLCFILREVFRGVRRIVKSTALQLTQAWRAPIAAHTNRTYHRLLKERNKARREGTLTEEQLAASNLQVARLILGAVFDSANIQQVSIFAARMGLYESVEGKPVFKHVLEPNEVIALMEQGVSAVCISYKHTRRSREGLPKDVARVHKAVAQAANQLSQQRLLFWCDVIGRTPQGVSWAKQGIDPYLCMPTLRIVSAELWEEIEESFWMTVEWIGALYRGGMITYAEDEGAIRFGIGKYYKLVVPNLSFPFEMAKLGTAKMICNPILYYRRARCEEDKLEVMKYAIGWALKERTGIFKLEQNKDGLLVNVASEAGFGELTTIVGFEKIGDPSDAIDLTRPQAETIIGDEDCWHGFEESFPALQLTEPQDRELLKSVFRDWGFLTRRVGPAVGDVTDVLCAPLFNQAWCSAMRLRVSDFEEYEDRVTGRVISFRVATAEEEKSLTWEVGTDKRVCFH